MPLTTEGLTSIDRQPRAVVRERTMPYEVTKRGDEYCVVDPEGKSHGCYSTREQAEAKRAAFYADEGKSARHAFLRNIGLPGVTINAQDAPSDVVVHFGGEVKAIPGTSRVEGLLIPYGGPDDLDSDGEFFTKGTDLGLRLPAAVKLFYHHGMNERLGRVPLAWAELEERADGVWFKSDFSEDLEWEDEERAKALKYRARALKLIREGLMGASSGAAAHVVVKRAASQGRHISRWPIAEASITPTPANQHTFGTVSLKALEGMPDLLEEDAPCGECAQRSIKAATDETTGTLVALLADWRTLAAREAKAGKPQFSQSRWRKLADLRDALNELLDETAPRDAEAAPSEGETVDAAPAPAAVMGADTTTLPEPESETLDHGPRDLFTMLAANPPPAWYGAHQ